MSKEDWTKNVDHQMFRKNIGRKEPSLQDILETILTKYFDHFEIRGMDQHNGTVRVYYEYCYDGKFHFMERDFFMDELLSISRRDGYVTAEVERQIKEVMK